MEFLNRLLEAFYGINDNQFVSRRSTVDYRRSKSVIWNKRRHFRYLHH
ncbi:MAG: hypothetical protein HRT68_11890 [Flavobacteriaceae bacterium]|nr:hypothetical protein [Flavobacteriaceae bacterium]